MVPEGAYNILTWISQRYSNPPLLITENGVDVPGESELPLAQALEDDFRVDFYSGYLQNVMKAMAEGVDVRGYFAWSMLVSAAQPATTRNLLTSTLPHTQ